MSKSSKKDTKTGFSRRSFLQSAGAGAAAVAAVGVTGVPAFAGSSATSAGGAVDGVRQATSGTHQGFADLQEVWGPNYTIQPGVLGKSSAKASGLTGLV